MSTERIDPLALLAIEADARARAGQEADKQIITAGHSKETSAGPSGTSMGFLSTASCHPIPIGGPEAYTYPSRAGRIVYTAKKDTQGRLTGIECKDFPVLAFPSAASTSPRFNVNRTSPLPAISSADSSPAPKSSAQQQSNRRKPSFALKLHALLADKNCRSVITWLPAGKSFCILDKEEFSTKWLPKYFGEAKFESFSRRLKRWGFQKMFIAGQSQVAYFHDHFQRDRLDLSKMMKGKEGGRSRNGVHGEVFETEEYEHSSAEHEIALLKQLTEAPKSDVHYRRMKYPFQMTPPPSISRQVSLAHPSSTFVMGRSSAAIMPFHQRGYVDPVPMAAVGFPSQDNGTYSMHQQRKSCGPTDTSFANELANIRDDISRCEEQLAILNRLKVLKEQYYAFHL